MLSIENADRGIIHVKASGKLAQPDYDTFDAQFSKVSQKNKPVRVLVELDGFEGWDAAGLWQELKFDVRHNDDMGRVAVVGDKSWEEWGTKISKPFFSADMKYFDKAQESEAREWLTQP
jgi:hypothetical protein